MCYRQVHGLINFIARRFLSLNVIQSHVCLYGGRELCGHTHITDECKTVSDSIATVCNSNSTISDSNGNIIEAQILSGKTRKVEL